MVAQRHYLASRATGFAQERSRMSRRIRTFVTVAAILGGLFPTKPVEACMMSAQLNLADVLYADLIVIGQISDYEIVPGAAKQIRQQQADSVTVPEEVSGYPGDYARFVVTINEILRGEAPQAFTATWDNSTYSEPKSMPPGLYLIALRNPQSPIPPLRGPSATVTRAPEVDRLTVLQAPCAEPFLFPAESKATERVRAILETHRGR